MNSGPGECGFAGPPPVFIVGCMKAGTTLPLALLDGHPDLLVMPSELNFFRYTDHPSLFPGRKLSGEPALPALAGKILEGLYFMRLLDGEQLERLQARFELRPQDLHDFSAIDPVAFAKHVREIAPGATHRELFLRFFEALLAATGRDPGSLARCHLVEKSPLQEEFAPLLKAWFPSARFLHVVRNPHATLSALRDVGSRMLVRGARRRYPYLRELCASIARSVRLGQWARSFLPDYRFLRYEDLVQEPEKTMRGVCDYIGISFHECLLEPTLAGKPWGGNSMSGRAFSGIERSATDRWRGDLSAFEIALVGRKLGSILRRFDYPQVEAGARWKRYLPQRRERLAAYLANRILLREPGEL